MACSHAGVKTAAHFRYVGWETRISIFNQILSPTLFFSTHTRHPSIHHTFYYKLGFHRLTLPRARQCNYGIKMAGNGLAAINSFLTVSLVLLVASRPR